jgi:hypothetical protein
LLRYLANVISDREARANARLEFVAATATPWSEIGRGGDTPATAALRGESLVNTRRGNAVVRGVTELAEQVTRYAGEQASLLGRPT